MLSRERVPRATPKRQGRKACGCAKKGGNVSLRRTSTVDLICRSRGQSCGFSPVAFRGWLPLPLPVLETSVPLPSISSSRATTSRSKLYGKTDSKKSTASGEGSSIPWWLAT